MYRATAYRSGDWWAIEVPDHPGVYSQARRIDQVAAMTADALSLWLEQDVNPDDIEVEVSAGDLSEIFVEAAQARKRAEEAREEATAAMREAVAQGQEAGLPLRDIGQLLGVTHQRAAAIAREAGDPAA